MSIIFIPQMESEIIFLFLLILGLVIQWLKILLYKYFLRNLKFIFFTFDTISDVVYADGPFWVLI